MRKFTAFALIGILALSASPIPHTKAAPATYVRRAEAMMILTRNAGIEVDLNAKSKGLYPDVLDGEWYVPYVLKGMELGLMEVDSVSGFAFPHRSVSRIEFLEMIQIAFRLTTNIPHEYEDVDSYYAGLSWKYNLLGSSENPHQLQPNLRITHQEAAGAILRLLRAEPSLQPVPGMFHSKNVATTNLHSSPTLVPFGTINVQPTKKVTLDSFVSASTPYSVKLAMLKLIRLRGNMAHQTRNDLLKKVNAERARYRLEPLTANYYLELSAQRHGKNMAERGYFSHYTPEGLSYVYRIKGAGYLDSNPEACSCAQQFDLGGAVDNGPDFLITGNEQCSCEPSFSLGENLAKGQLTVDQVMDDWMDSPNHRMNILRPEFTEIGIGLYEDVWVQNFGNLTFR